METMGEKHAFFKKRKCGSRKVLRFMRSLLYALAVLSLPMRGAWIEITIMYIITIILSSLPMRGAWIEIYTYCSNKFRRIVAPHAGSVD